jgi:hypothetical protein
MMIARQPRREIVERYQRQVQAFQRRSAEATAR